MGIKKLIVDFRMHSSSGIGTYLRNIVPFLVKDFDVVLLCDSSEISGYDFYDDVRVIEFNFSIYSLQEQLYFPLKIES